MQEKHRAAAAVVALEALVVLQPEAGEIFKSSLHPVAKEGNRHSFVFVVKYLFLITSISHGHTCSYL